MSHQNEVYKNKDLSYCEAPRCEKNNKKKKLFSFMLNLQTYYHFKLDFQKVDQHTGGKWFIYGTKRRMDNQLPGTPLCNILVGNVNMT